MKRPAKILIGCFALFLAGVAVFFGALIYYNSPVNSSDRTAVTFVISHGEGVQEIGAKLQRQGLIRSAGMFTYHAVAKGRMKHFLPGEYTLSRSMSPQNIVGVLSSKPIEEAVRILIPEGWSSAQIARALEEKGFCSAGQFMDIVRNPAENGIEIRGYDITNLEGFLFPDTYTFKPKTDCSDIAKRLVRRFFEKLTAGMLAQSESLGLNMQQMVTLASLIEKESVRADERRHISGVIFNRLRNHIKLQVDATYKYKAGVWAPDVNRGGPGSDPDYDTYRIDGLPPGPICNPGEASIDAAVNPDLATRDLYYVAREDGSGGHYFSDTAAGHAANINLSHRNRSLRR